MQIDLSGKTALVTGSTGGIGKAIAIGLARAGATVAINGRGAERVATAIAAIEAGVPGARLIAAPGDVGTADGVAAVVKALPAVDILVNNAGIFAPQGFFDIPDSEWTRFYEVNVLSGVRLSRAYMPAMLDANWGRIVFISSESALHIPPEMIHYGVSKTAQLAVARGLAEMTAGTGVTVNSVLPGPTRSDGAEEFLTAMAAGSSESVDEIAATFVKQLRPSSLLQRFASVEEVANMVVYACSKQASATNGAALKVEGGIVRYIV